MTEREMALPDQRLIPLLERQGFRELVSAHLFAAGVTLAPSIDDKHMLADHAREELEHFEVVSAVYEKLAGRALHDAVRERAAEIPSPSTWLEAAVAGYLIDRAAASALLEYENVDDSRLTGIIDDITEHEHEHMTAAGAALRDVCRTATAAELRAASVHLSRWFGIATSLLDTSSSDSRAATAFVESTKPTLVACGLSLPNG
jgi:1,2-phenylacetyl-CoA epoxidase catalytic subunit